MSVNENFPSKQIESQYFKTLYNLIYLLQQEILDNYKKRPSMNESYSNDLFISYFKRFFFLINFLDYKMHPYPKYSYALKELATHLEIINQNHFQDKSNSQMKVELKNLQLNKSSFSSSNQKSHFRSTHSSYNKGRSKIGFQSQNNSNYSSKPMYEIYELNNKISNMQNSIPTIVNQETFYNIYNIHNMSHDYNDYPEISPTLSQKSNPYHHIIPIKHLRDTRKDYLPFHSKLVVKRKLSHHKPISQDNQDNNMQRSEKENIYNGTLNNLALTNSKEKINQISKQYSHS